MAALIVLAALAIVALIAVARTIRIVPQARAGVVARRGRYQPPLDPGLAPRGDPPGRGSQAIADPHRRGREAELDPACRGPARVAATLRRGSGEGDRDSLPGDPRRRRRSQAARLPVPPDAAPDRAGPGEQ